MTLVPTITCTTVQHPSIHDHMPEKPKHSDPIPQAYFKPQFLGTVTMSFAVLKTFQLLPGRSYRKHLHLANHFEGITYAHYHLHC